MKAAVTRCRVCLAERKLLYSTTMASQLKCPKCGSVVYSRRKPFCGRCGERLPESVLFDPATRKKVEKVIESERKQADWEGKFPGHPSSSGEYGSIL